MTKADIIHTYLIDIERAEMSLVNPNLPEKTREIVSDNLYRMRNWVEYLSKPDTPEFKDKS